MPDFEDKIPISEFSYTNTLHNTDQAPIIQQDGADWDNFRTSMADIGLHINKEMEYVTDLHTTSKKIIGAINELADGGSSADIITLLDTPAPIQTFSDGGDNIPMKSCEVAIVAQQAGLGKPSPSNPMAISGFNSVVIGQTRKNIFRGILCQADTYFDATGVFTSNAYFSIYYVDIKKDITYTISLTESATSGTRVVRVGTFDNNNGLIEIASNTYSASGRQSLTFSFTSDFDHALVLLRNTTSDVQLELGSTATAYEQPTTHTVSLGQTIYGATADVVNGNGSKTSDIWNTLSSGNWSVQGSGDSEFFALSVSGVDVAKINELLCNKYKTLTPTLSNTDDNIIGLISSGTTLRIRDKRYTASTINDFKSSLSDCVVVYPLATPTAFTFTGANIPTLSGTNNIYADSGDIQSLEYFNDKGDDIASMVRLMTRT